VKKTYNRRHRHHHYHRQTCQCYDTVGLATGRTSNLENILLQQLLFIGGPWTPPNLD